MREETDIEVVTSAQAPLVATWGRIIARALYPGPVNSCPLPSSGEHFLLQASGIRRW